LLRHPEDRIGGRGPAGHRGEARDALQRYLVWYNGQRLHSTLAYVSPTQYEVCLAAA